MFNAQQVTSLGFGLVVYIIIYVICLVYLILSSSKETKLIQRYSEKKNGQVWRKILLAIAGGVVGVLLFVLYLKYA